ncbi:acyltransferase [Dinghuibacter silviterrae]|uniref:Phenylacetic acid degradation protein n=1 Tax=Dinghuibacter silviterrae TaxID=1539049 RepID=A0A4R8DPC4_9BACT|nr:transferase hexapeptide repeat family protein [Dinghuibacter silviterrae]TDW99931.1 phenylacetic acid degradation protein [Dinghuibacter silviterrae]
MFYTFGAHTPVVHETAYVHPQAVVTGNVVIGKDVYIGPGAMLRGDWGGIRIADGCNIQENCVVHMFPGITVVLEEEAHIGHGAIIHGARIGKHCLVGMNSVVLDRVVIGEGSIIGALTLVTEGMQIPPRSLVVGNPGRIIREVPDDMLVWKNKGTALYRRLPADMHGGARACEPLREVPPGYDAAAGEYKSWKDPGRE